MIFAHTPKALWWLIVRKEYMPTNELAEQLALGVATKDKNRLYLWSDLLWDCRVHYSMKYQDIKDFVKYIEPISRGLSIVFFRPTAAEVQSLDASLHYVMAVYFHAVSSIYGLTPKKAEGQHWRHYYFAVGLSDKAVETAVKALKFRIVRRSALKLRSMDTLFGKAPTC